MTGPAHSGSDPVIIAGAGPIGLTLALALARHDVPSIVLDEGTGVAPESSRSTVLRADTVGLLRRVGYTRVTADGRGWNAWRTLRRNRELHSVELGHDDVLHLAQHRLLRGLRDAVSATGLVEVQPESALLELEQEPGQEAVNVHTQRTWLRGSFLVGCDGPRSTVRKRLALRFPGRAAADHYALATIRADLPFPGEAVLHRDQPRQSGAPVAREVAARPLPDGVWRLDWRLPPRAPGFSPDQLIEQIRATLAAWNGGRVPTYELISSADYVVQQRLATRFQVGRAFLAGDSAHLLGSLGMQNLDEGLRDVDNLAWKLGLVWHGCASERLLTTYQQERRSAVIARLRAVDQAMPLLQPSTPLLEARRSLLSGSLRRNAELLSDGSLGTGRLGGAPAYPTQGRSAAALSPALSPTSPGVLVPDIPVITSEGTEDRLRARLGRGFLVVLVAPGTGVWATEHWLGAGLMPQLTEATEALPLPAELLVTESYPGAAAHTVLLIRPDGHLVAAVPGIRTDELHDLAEQALGAAAELPVPRSASEAGQRERLTAGQS